MTHSDKALLKSSFKLLAYRLAQFAIITTSLGLIAFVIYHVLAFGPKEW
jgi:hypothetical protein